MKKITKIVLCLSVVLLLTGCNSKKEEKKEKPKGKCEIKECINLIGLNDNLEKVNEIIGFEGKGKDNTYSWKLTSTQKVEVTFGNNNEVKIKLLDEEIKNKKTKFTKYSKLEEQLKAGETVTIDDLNKAFKSNGVLIEKNSTELKYRWVDSEESYIEATINATNGKCYILSGMI